MFSRIARRGFHASAATARRRSRLPVNPTPSVEEAVINILHNTPPPKATPRGARHILSCLAHNEPGVISRVAGILQARGFNIESLVAAHTELPGLSRMTVALNGDGKQMEQAKRQLEDIVPMWAVLDYSRTKLVERELLLVRVSLLGPDAPQASAEMQSEAEATEEQEGLDLAAASRKLRETSEHLRALTELTRLFDGKLLDVSSDSVIIELCAKPDRITSFIKLCKPFGVIEASRTGVMALPRSPVHDDSAVKEQVEESEAVDATMLPPG